MTVKTPKRINRLFAQRLYDLRMGMNWSQAQLGERLGTSQPQVLNMEAGNLPRSATLRRLAIVLGVSSDFLLGLADEPS